MSESTLDQLKKFTVVVADTGDFESIQEYCPQDSTTNPSLILAASKLPRYAHLMNEAIAYAKNKSSVLEKQLEIAKNKLFVLFGVEILKIIPGRVSTEVDAMHSFSVEKQIESARQLIDMYEEMGVNKNRVLIKLSSTWEGIKAAEILESKYGIRCNLTLMFSMAQARACAQAKVTLISPFVGRVYDWYVEKQGSKDLKFVPRETDPGVQLVTQIYHHYKSHGYKTEIMGASFRNIDQILGLVGCDLLTISPSLLKELRSMTEKLTPIMDMKKIDLNSIEQTIQPLSEDQFRWLLNEDQMATDKLSDGIRRFAKDSKALTDLLRSSFN